MPQNRHTALAIRALQHLKGDDLYRARSMFRTYTTEQMDKPYGSIDETPSQMIAAYERHESDINQAIEWLEGL